MDFLEWLGVVFIKAFGHVPFDAGFIGLVFGMGAVEFAARMLPARTEPTIATRISWAVACVTAFAVSMLLNPTALGFAIAATVSVSAPSLQLLIMRELYAWRPHLKPESMRENREPKQLPPPSEFWP